MRLWVVAAAVLVLNLPFGYWRASVKKRSLQWFLAIHIPVPAVVALRILSGLGWQPVTFPIMIGHFFAGQLFGGKWYSLRKRRGHGRVTSCLIMDMIKRT